MSQERIVRLLKLMDVEKVFSAPEIGSHFPEIAQSNVYHWLYRLVAAGFLEKISIPAEGGVLGRPTITGYRSLWRSSSRR